MRLSAFVIKQQQMVVMDFPLSFLPFYLIDVLRQKMVGLLR